MIPLEKTTLKIIGCNLDNGKERHLFFIIDNLKADDQSLQRFIREAFNIENHSINVLKKDVAFEDMIESYGIIDVFDDDEISGLIKDGLVDIKNLHKTLYELITVEAQV